MAGLMAHLRETRPQHSGPHLIVVPLSVLANWISEVEQWCPTLRTVKFHGVKDERQRLKVLLRHSTAGCTGLISAPQDDVLIFGKFDVCVTTYEQFISEAYFFKHR